jgi:hypothetical protein
MRRIVICNRSEAELGVRLEPWTDREDAAPGESIVVEGKFSDDEIGIDFFGDSFLSIWCPVGTTLRKASG